uniref:Uncharacterized protein n=1 Tax=Cannabis sativa TaxID=3483 RepID=A0A803NTV0_CANSA
MAPFSSVTTMLSPLVTLSLRILFTMAKLCSKFGTSTSTLGFLDHSISKEEVAAERLGVTNVLLNVAIVVT